MHIELLFGPEADRRVEEMTLELASDGVKNPEMLARFMVTVCTWKPKHSSVDIGAFTLAAIDAYKAHGIYAFPALSKFWESGA